LPRSIGFETPDEECKLNIVTGAPEKREISWAMSNALGFGGQNSCIITGKYQR
jgi:3-oxoacyl-[acyl-carrier-protein] synthase II